MGPKPKNPEAEKRKRSESSAAAPEPRPKPKKKKQSVPSDPEDAVMMPVPKPRKAAPKRVVDSDEDNAQQVSPAQDPARVQDVPKSGRSAPVDLEQDDADSDGGDDMGDGGQDGYDEIDEGEDLEGLSPEQVSNALAQEKPQWTTNSFDNKAGRADKRQSPLPWKSSHLRLLTPEDKIPSSKAAQNSLGRRCRVDQLALGHRNL
ncbi:hypothetical protein B0H19DRAFT_1083912 [Mycena capillaripes]|nr:hypothetical protein B0H19DRAFT_1083912 [Mycena capillaripes]